MTKQKTSSRVGDVLPHVLTDLKLSEPLRAYRAVDRWADAVGEQLAQHARAVSIHQGVLLVEADSSAWMQEIQFHKRRILDRLEQSCGKRMIRELKCVLRSGTGKA
jgi:predicted nucleic acid-binding Zn ribbon protein